MSNQSPQHSDTWAIIVLVVIVVLILVIGVMDAPYTSWTYGF